MLPGKCTGLYDHIICVVHNYLYMYIIHLLNILVNYMYSVGVSCIGSEKILAIIILKIAHSYI